MYLQPEGYENIVVLVKDNEEYEYYVSDKELWILDLRKLKEAFEISGYNTNTSSFEGERTGFDVLTKEQYGIYKNKIEKYKVSYDELKGYYELFRLAQQPEDDVREILPTFYIDFDKNIFYSFYTEPGSYGEYIPDGWQGYLINGCDKVIPSSVVYWRK
ncbi:hypothetical protein ACIGHG_14325 [Bacillus sp. NPDC077411]|uniref:hypothetical protein n=1 Tax=Bacillus sp. NPDC077411 TaxID=3363947 RepID=UPI0037CBBD6C